MIFEKIIDKARSVVDSVRIRKKYLPFDVKELEGMIGQDFYVVVLGKETHKNIFQKLIRLGISDDYIEDSLVKGSIMEVNSNKDDKEIGYC